jgi:beta-lactamase class D
MRTHAAAVLLLALGWGCSAPPAGQSPTIAFSAPTVDVAAQTEGRPACLVVTTASGGIVIRSQPERCAKRLRPYSTFKIPNSLIALEIGIVADASSVIPWNESAYPKEPWWPEVWTSREHDLRSAFRHSFVPYYREVAKRIGVDPMDRYVRQFRYGNQSIEGSIDSFWLDGGIGISADEQVRFLRDLYDGRLGVSSRTTEIVKAIMVRERRGDHIISAKTGTGEAPGGGVLGWLVGFVEHGADVHFFAFHVVDPTHDAIGSTWRFERVTTMLTQLSLWPTASP